MDFVLIFLLIFAALIGIPITLSIFIFKWLNKKGYNKSAIILPAIIIGVPIYIIYTAFYPSESFYVEEFELKTALPFPESGKIIKKESSYPDQHGDYYSVAIIEFSEDDYKELLSKISNDTTFVANSEFGITFQSGFNRYNTAANTNKKDIQIILANKNKGWFTIAFMKDQKTIIFEHR